MFFLDGNGFDFGSGKMKVGMMYYHLVEEMGVDHDGYQWWLEREMNFFLGEMFFP